MTRRLVALASGGLFAGWMASLGLLYSWQDALVFPGAHMAMDVPRPEEGADLGWRVHILARSDDPPLQLWHRPARDGIPTRGALVMLHGNGGHPIQFQRHAVEANARGWHVVAPVYRGYAGMPGTPDQAGVVEDAVSAYDWARDTLAVPSSRLAIHGHSLGGGVAAQLAAQRGTPLVVLASSFDSLREMIQRRYPMFPVGLTLMHPFDSAQALSSHDGALLLLHAEDDPVVPIDAMRRLADHFPDATVVVGATGGHDPPVAVSEAARQAWLDALAALP